MKRLVLLVVLSGGVAAAAMLHQSTAQAAGTCGEKGQPDCPLQGWMNKNMDAASEKGDTKALAVAFEKVAGFAPDPKWNEGEKGWSKIAKDGEAAAKSGNLSAAKKECKTCHKAWRDKYKAQYRTKPVP